MIRIDESEIRGHLNELVRGTVEETLNGLLDAEADEMCHAQRYERSAERVDMRAGHYRRRLHTQAGEVELKVPKLRRQTFETAIIERYRRRKKKGVGSNFPSFILKPKDRAPPNCSITLSATRKALA